MGLVEFLRQWQRGRLTIGVGLSLLVHALLLLALWWGPPVFRKETARRGEPLIVELPEAQDSPPPGRPGAPPTPRPAPRPTPPAPPAAARPAPRPQAVAKASPPPPAPPAAQAPSRAPSPAPEPALRPAPSAPPEPQGTEPPPMTKPAEPAPAAKTPESPPAAAEPPATPPSPETASRPPEPRVAAVPPAPAAPRGGATVPDIRALGRGTGGAGGSGHGRAGIEGQPIPLESDDPRFSAYLEQLRRMLQSKMTWPCDGVSRKRGDCLDRDEELLAEFGILKNGQLAFIEVRQPSRQPIYDESSENVIKLASPFPPPPPVMLAAMKHGSTGVAIMVHFRYSQTVSYRMLLMP